MTDPRTSKDQVSQAPEPTSYVVEGDTYRKMIADRDAYRSIANDLARQLRQRTPADTNAPNERTSGEPELDDLSSHDLESMKQCAQGWHAVFGDLLHGIPDFWDAPVDTENKTGMDRVRMHIRRLLERAAQPPSLDWRQIDTAPREPGGAPILGFWHSTSSDRVEWRQFGLAQWNGHAWADPENGDEFREPTHWMPLPSPPTKVGE